MKAKDYAKKYNDSPTNEMLVEIANSFIKEIDELIESRHAKSNSACMAIFKELDQKWVAFSNLSPGISRSGFRVLVQEFFPLLVPAMGWGNPTQPTPDAGESAPLQALTTSEHSATSQNLSTPPPAWVIQPFGGSEET